MHGQGFMMKIDLDDDPKIVALLVRVLTTEILFDLSNILFGPCLSFHYALYARKLVKRCKFSIIADVLFIKYRSYGLCPDRW
mmetsp:Transcript_2509/g.4236  ORF Transcript_2509/g.4236 Transcript_2509/m.4236 type:complete len:82 (-) Transcript_2509:625-870(-)